MNTNAAYYVTANYEDCAITVTTNSADVAICALMEHASNGAPVDVVDGYTGEVYVTANAEEDYITEEWAMMILGWLMMNAWGI